MIGLAAGLGGALVLCILCCCWRSYRRRRARSKYIAANGPMPTAYNGRRGGPPPHQRGYPPQQQGYGQPPMAHGYPQQGYGQQQQQWQGSAGVPMPPPLQNRSSMRYA